MNCWVPVKRVIDFSVKVRVKRDGSGVETDNVKMSMNPFDEIALEEAYRLKEAGIVTSITAVSIGTSACQEICRVALARGADRAILVETDAELPPLSIAKILKTLLLKESVSLIIMGKQAIDDDCNQTGQMLAALLGWPQGTFASQVIVHSDPCRIEVTREVDGGLETLELTCPAVITTDLRLNEPRYVSLPNIMRAKNKPLERIPLESLNLSFRSHLKTIEVAPPPIRKMGVKVLDVATLVDKLRNEAKVI